MSTEILEKPVVEETTTDEVDHNHCRGCLDAGDPITAVCGAEETWDGEIIFGYPPNPCVVCVDMTRPDGLVRCERCGRAGR